jgi:hypothetical protein
MGKFVDLTGKQIGKWKVIQRVFKKEKQTHWLCECSCGKHSLVQGTYLICGKSTKCKTCHNREASKKVPIKHGHCRKVQSKEYNHWSGMKTRCLNPNADQYIYYGKRGIKICDEWVNDFSKFNEDMGEAPKGCTLDRIDVNGDYSKNNCRWATKQQQSENKRSNIFLERDGIVKTKTQWAKDYGIPFTSFDRLIKKEGWPLPKPPGEE